ncbi:hypothetical protein MTR_0030s0420 [Medicago truncatula]|uniref:Uncharacterized protein n=1 Tax=Medicago truncatula TaxID=3880 RepID=A0A072TI76_MEDTR|nr:hypothetical protein MTR_0030s0420 [Medicago truncatula]
MSRPKSGRNWHPHLPSYLVHARTSRHQDMKRRIQSKLEALAHPDIRSNEDWLELRLS